MMRIELSIILLLMSSSICICKKFIPERELVEMNGIFFNAVDEARKSPSRLNETLRCHSGLFTDILI